MADVKDNRGETLRQTEIARWGSEEAWIEQLRKRGAKGGRAKHTKPRGFATMSRARVSQIGKKGGKHRNK